MNSKKTLKESFDSLGIKKVLLVLLSLAITIFIFIFSLLSSIQNTQIIVNPSSPSSGSNSTSPNILELTDAASDLDIHTSSSTHTFKVALATTPETRRKGLMDIKSMDSEEGMFFIFPENQHLSFWMKNTYIPLDIIFIDENFQIIKIYENTKPLDTTIRYKSNSKAKYVLELNAYSTSTKGITEGDRVELKTSPAPNSY